MRKMPIHKYSYPTDWGECTVISKVKGRNHNLIRPYGTSGFSDNHYPVKISSAALEYRYKNDFCERFNSDILSLEFIRKGIYRFIQFGQEHTVNENELFLVQPGAEYCKQLAVSDYTEKWYLVMNGPLLKQTLELLDLNRVSHIRPGNPEKLTAYFHRIYDLLKNASPQDYRLACAESYSLLLELAAQNTEGAQPEALHNAVYFMQCNVNQQLTLDVIAEHCRISKIKLYRLFKEHYQKSPIDYFLDLKMKKAVQLLKLHSLSVKQIAFELNYASPQYFAMEFRKQYGMTPKQFQKNPVAYKGS